MECFFDGLGTAIVTSILSLLIGGRVGYKIGINQKIKQNQKAGDNAEQTQIGNIVNDKADSKSR